jgi:hypothetical protein
MSTAPRNASTHSLHTATALYDPALLRLTTRTHTIILVAADVSYDHATRIRLYNVRWVKARRGLASILRRREPFFWAQDQLQLTKSPTHILAALPHHPSLRVRTAKFAFKNISADQFASLRRQSPRRLLLAGNQLLTAPRRPILVKAAFTLHRFRLAIRTLLPKLAH